MTVSMNNNPLGELHRLVWTALMAALIAVGAYLVFPLGTIPFSMQPFFVFLAGYILGPIYGPASVLIYIAAGVAGLPVFERSTSGLGHLLGPTGGYLIGFVICAAVVGLSRISSSKTISWTRGIVFGLMGLIVVFAVGFIWLKYNLSMEWGKAFMAGVAPFIVWDLIKVALALACLKLLEKNRLLPF